MEKTPDAIKAFEQVTRIQPKHAQSYFNLGNLYTQSKRLPDAVKAFQQATRLNPKDSDAFFNLGNSYSGLKQFDEAIKAYQEAVKLKPDDAEAHLRLGVLYLEKGNREAAKAEFNTLKAMNPQLATVLNDRINQQK